MSMSVMRTRLFLPFVALGAMVLTGCNFQDSKKLHDYMEKQNYPQTELDSVLKVTQRDDEDIQAMVRQSAVDSMLYRDLFNTTSLAHDSATIAELNKIAAKASLEKVSPVKAIRGDIVTSCKNYVYNQSCFEGISIQEAYELKSDLNKVGPKYLDGSDLTAKLQAFADKYFYGKFFKEKGLLDNKEFAKQFEETAILLSTHY